MQANLTLPNSKKSKRKKKRTSFKNEMKNNWIAYLMAVPGIVFIFMFSTVPMAFITLAFQKYNVRTGFFHSPWVGFDNFIEIFSLGNKLWQVVFNTLYLNIWFITTSTIMAILVAILVNEIKNKMFKRITQSIFFFPYFLSWVVVSAKPFGIRGEMMKHCAFPTSAQARLWRIPDIRDVLFSSARKQR